MIGSKRAQAGAAVLVALLAMLIILYVLFLPPADRAALLGDGTPTGGPGGEVAPSNILFSSPLGRVYLPSTPAKDHHLPSLAVRTVESGSILASADSLTASNNAFQKRPATLLFTADPALTRNVVLSFNLASRTGGNVIVDHNGYGVFNQDVRSRSVSPISLQIGQSQNNLTFTASSVGFAFWRTNEYTLTNVKVTADVTDLSAATARQTFAISAEEYQSMDQAQLSFVPICEREGTILIILNSNELFNGVPDCDVANTLEIPPSKLQAGENTLSFSTRDGDFLMDLGNVRTKGKQQTNRVFHFTIDPAAVQGHQVLLRVLFADAGDHRGKILLNGNTIPLAGSDIVGIPITPYIKPGDNTVSIEAANKEFEVVKIDVLRT
jgi:hypothetical protein